MRNIVKGVIVIISCLVLNISCSKDELIQDRQITIEDIKTHNNFDEIVAYRDYVLERVVIEKNENEFLGATIAFKKIQNKMAKDLKVNSNNIEGYTELMGDVLTEKIKYSKLLGCYQAGAVDLLINVAKCNAQNPQDDEAFGSCVRGAFNAVMTAINDCLDALLG